MFLYVKYNIPILKMFEKFNMPTDGIRVILFLTTLSLWIACFVINKNAKDALKSNNMNEMKKQIEQLKNAVWVLYTVYLAQYFMNVTMPVFGMVSGNSNISIIGLILSTMLVMCITHIFGTCTDETCDKKMALQYLERVDILLSILVVVHIGTMVAFVVTSKTMKYGFTAEILNLLKSPSGISSRSGSRRTSPLLPPLHGEIDY